MHLILVLGANFGEPVGWRRWSAIVAGFIGVLIIVRPGLAGFSQYSLFALVSVAFCALRDLATRRIPPKIPSLFITLLTTVTVTTAGGVILVPLGGWTPPSTGARGGTPSARSRHTPKVGSVTPRRRSPTLPDHGLQPHFSLPASTAAFGRAPPSEEPGARSSRKSSS